MKSLDLLSVFPRNSSSRQWSCCSARPRGRAGDSSQCWKCCSLSSPQTSCVKLVLPNFTVSLNDQKVIFLLAPPASTLLLSTDEADRQESSKLLRRLIYYDLQVSPRSQNKKDCTALPNCKPALFPELKPTVRGGDPTGSKTALADKPAFCKNSASRERRSLHHCSLHLFQ